MKRIVVLVLLVVSLASCKKEPKVDEITYEVILTNAPTWWGMYLNEKAELVDVHGMKSNWRYTFKNVNGLKALSLMARPDCPDNNQNAVMNVYVNGKLYVTSSYQPHGEYIKVGF